MYLLRRRRRTKLSKEVSEAEILRSISMGMGMGVKLRAERAGRRGESVRRAPAAAEHRAE